MLKVVPDEALLLFREGDELTLLVSDIHLGLEKELAARGLRIRPYSTKMMEEIRSVQERYRPGRIVVLGDVKHSIGKVEDIDWSVIPWFFDSLLDIFPSVEVVPGNHDGGIKNVLPPRVKLHPTTGAVIGAEEKVGVIHGHSWPSEEVISTGRLVMGHSHFTYELIDRFGSRNRESVWLFAEFDVAELERKAGYLPDSRARGELVVMPPFNRLVGGQPINRKGSFKFGPILSSGCIDVTQADIFLLDGTRVG